LSLRIKTIITKLFNLKYQKKWLSKYDIEEHVDMLLKIH